MTNQTGPLAVYDYQLPRLGGSQRVPSAIAVVLFVAMLASCSKQSRSGGSEANLTPQQAGANCTFIGRELLKISADTPESRRLTGFVGLTGISEDDYARAQPTYATCSSSVLNTFNTEIPKRISELAERSEGLLERSDEGGVFARWNLGRAGTSLEQRDPAKFKTLMRLIDDENKRDKARIQQLKDSLATRCGADPATHAVYISFVRGQFVTEAVASTADVHIDRHWTAGEGGCMGDCPETIVEITPSRGFALVMPVAAPTIDDGSTNSKLICNLTFGVNQSPIPVSGKGVFDRTTGEISFIPNRNGLR